MKSTITTPPSLPPFNEVHVGRAALFSRVATSRHTRHCCIKGVVRTEPGRRDPTKGAGGLYVTGSFCLKFFRPPALSLRRSRPPPKSFPFCRRIAESVIDQSLLELLIPAPHFLLHSHPRGSLSAKTKDFPTNFSEERMARRSRVLYPRAVSLPLSY